MNRYLLFSGSAYYPSGGWGDFTEASNDLNALLLRADNLIVDDRDWYQVVDIQTMQLVRAKGFTVDTTYK